MSDDVKRLFNGEELKEPSPEFTNRLIGKLKNAMTEKLKDLNPVPDLDTGRWLIRNVEVDPVYRYPDQRAFAMYLAYELRYKTNGLSLYHPLELVESIDIMLNYVKQKYSEKYKSQLDEIKAMFADEDASDV